jgi:hypothetical protein
MAEKSESRSRKGQKSDIDGKECTILYLKNLDMSGENMVRDTRERLEEMGLVQNIKTKEIGLT